MQICSRCNGSGLFGNCSGCGGSGFSSNKNSPSQQVSEHARVASLLTLAEKRIQTPPLSDAAHKNLTKEQIACAALRKFTRSHSFGYRSKGGNWFSNSEELAYANLLIVQAGVALPDSLRKEVQRKMYPQQKLLRQKKKITRVKTKLKA